MSRIRIPSQVKKWVENNPLSTKSNQRVVVSPLSKSRLFASPATTNRVPSLLPGRLLTTNALPACEEKRSVAQYSNSPIPSPFEIASPYIKSEKPIKGTVIILNQAVVVHEAATIAKKEGWQVIVMSPEAEQFTSNIRASMKLVDEFILNSLKDLAVLKAKLEKLSKTYPHPVLVHPGYGFLSENDKLPKLCEELGLVFVGPNTQAMKALGNKTEARKLAKACNVPVIPGYEGNEKNIDKLAGIASQIGYPIMVKLPGGGGGTSNWLVADESELRSQSVIFLSKDEGSIILEKAIKNPRHMEVQVLATVNPRGKPDVVILGPIRDCSVQRFFQKIVEIAPAILTDDAARHLKFHALKLVTAACQQHNYTGLVTVEFLVDAQGAYFLEANTRLQVEHGVNDDILGIDLIGLQFHVALGRPLPDYFKPYLKQRNINLGPHMTAQDMVDALASSSGVKVSIEARVNVMPGNHQLIARINCLSAGQRGKYVWGYLPSDTVNTFKTNPTVGLVRGHGRDHEEAIRNLRELVANISVRGYSNYLSQEMLGKYLSGGHLYRECLPWPQINEISTNKDDILRILDSPVFKAKAPMPNTSLCAELDQEQNPQDQPASALGLKSR